MSVVLPALTSEWARFVSQLKWEDIPAAVRERASSHLLDTIGLSTAAAKLTTLPKIAGQFAEIDANRDCVVLGTDYRLSAEHAALMNGMTAHAFDLDDTHMESITHPSCVFVPTALAIGETVGADVRSIVTALVAGYEIACRMSDAIPGHSLFHRGYQTTTLYGVFGATAIAGKLLGLSADIQTHAFGFAASQAGGLRQFSAPHEVSEGKRFHAGWPALSGITAARIAKAGLTAPRQVLEGDRGIYVTHLGLKPEDPHALVRELGSRWETLNLAVKVHSCAQAIQGFLDAVLQLQADNAVASASIDSVELYVSEFAVNQLCEPYDEKRRPPSPYLAVLALPFCTALALVRGAVLPSHLDKATTANQEILEMAFRVSHVLDPEADIWGGSVALVLKDGRRLERAVEAARGSPQNPLSRDGYIKKFIRTTEGLISGDRQRAIIQSILEDPHQSSSNFYSLL